LIDRKIINNVETNNFIVECESSLTVDDVLSEVKKCINKEGLCYFSKEYFFFNSSEISEDIVLSLKSEKYTQQIFTIFFHNVEEFYRLVLSDNIDYFELQNKKIYFIFVIPSFDIGLFNDDPRYDHFNHIYIEPGEFEIVDSIIENKTERSIKTNLTGFDLFEKSGFSNTSDHFKFEYLSNNNYNRETIKKMAFFGIISNDLKEYFLKKIAKEESYIDKFSSFVQSIKTFFLSIF
jgi:hypothetical protein